MDDEPKPEMCFPRECECTQSDSAQGCVFVRVRPDEDVFVCKNCGNAGRPKEDDAHD